MPISALILPARAYFPFPLRDQIRIVEESLDNLKLQVAKICQVTGMGPDARPVHEGASKGRENLGVSAARRDNVHPNPELPAGTRSKLADYRGSGYDRGNMGSAKTFKRSMASLSTTLVVFNLASHRPTLNRSICLVLEEDVRPLLEALVSASPRGAIQNGFGLSTPWSFLWFPCRPMRTHLT